MYENHRATSSADRFIVFMVLALARSASQDDPEYGAVLDMNEPRAYFDTALRFFVSFYDHLRDIFWHPRCASTLDLDAKFIFQQSLQRPLALESLCHVCSN